MGALKIVYEDIAVNSQEYATATATPSTDLSDLSKLCWGSTPPTSALLELNSWGLGIDDTSSYKQITGECPVTYWSKVASKDDCTFDSDPYIEIAWKDENNDPIEISTSALTFIFSTEQDDYCSEVHLLFKKTVDGSLEDLREDTVYPDSTNYIHNLLPAVEGFDYLKVTFIKTVLPYTRVKINQIFAGAIRIFDASQIEESTIQAETNTISDEVAISTMDWALIAQDQVDYLFQNQQKIKTYTDDKLLMQTYITDSSQKYANMFDVKSQDVLGLLNDQPIASTRVGTEEHPVQMMDVIDLILGDDTNFMYYVDPVVAQRCVHGYIPEGTKKDALQQLCFACGASISTYCPLVADNGRIYDFKITKATQTNPFKLGYHNVAEGMTINTQKKVTSVTLISHSLVEDESGDIEIDDTKYKDITTEHTRVNPDVVNYDAVNNVMIDTMFLVGTGNTSPEDDMFTVDKLLDLVYNYIVKPTIVQADILLDANIKDAEGNTIDHHLIDGGEYLEFPDPWVLNGRDITRGNVQKLSISLSNLLVASVEVR